MGFCKGLEVYATESYGDDEFARNMKSLGESASQIEKTSGSMAMPMFDGTNPSLWFSKVEKFFNIGRFADEVKLDLVFLCLEGVALKWFLREISTLKFRDWAAFENRLLARFGPVQLCATEHSISKLDSETNGSKMETDGVAQLKVSISPLEPYTKFSNASLDVRDNLSSVFFEQSQVVNALEVVEMSTSVKTTQCALQLFDKMLMRDRRRNQQLKQRKHLKAWRFKFKMKSSTRELKDSCSLANVGSNGKRIFQRGKMRKQAYISWLRSRLIKRWDFGVIQQPVTPEIYRGLHYVDNDTQRTVSRVWHRWKNKAGILLTISELLRWCLVHSALQRITGCMLFALFHVVYQESEAATKIQPLTERVYKDQLQAGNTMVSIWLRIQVQTHLFPHRKLEDKLVFNGGSNGEAATGLGNEMFMILQSFPVCCWTRSGLEIQGDMKLMFFSATELGESYRVIVVTPILPVCFHHIVLQLLQDVNVPLISHISQLHCLLGSIFEKHFVSWLHVVYMWSSTESMLMRLKEKSSNSWKFAFKHESVELQQHLKLFGPECKLVNWWNVCGLQSRISPSFSFGSGFDDLYRELDEDTIYLDEESSKATAIVLHKFKKHKFLKAWKWKFKYKQKAYKRAAY